MFHFVSFSSHFIVHVSSHFLQSILYCSCFISFPSIHTILFMFHFILQFTVHLINFIYHSTILSIIIYHFIYHFIYHLIHFVSFTYTLFGCTHITSSLKLKVLTLDIYYLKVNSNCFTPSCLYIKYNNWNVMQVCFLCFSRVQLYFFMVHFMGSFLLVRPVYQ